MTDCVGKGGGGKGGREMGGWVGSEMLLVACASGNWDILRVYMLLGSCA